ncbi:MAG: phosphate starvation-inducible protein PhoH, partial [Flavobacteriales bacterium]|nr:phosphate starvation-inducible protein PhoH [Flavobacteriales bacterium]
MQEKEFIIEGIDPISILGVNNSKLRLIKKHFPTLKVIARGEVIKVAGEPKEVERFSKRFKEMKKHVERFNSITESDISNLMDDGPANGSEGGDDSVLLYGNKGLRIKTRTKGHERLVKSTEKNDLVLVSGPAGTGKTFTAVALAVR